MHTGDLNEDAKCNVIEAHAPLLIRRTDLEQIRSRINNNLIAGHFGPVGLCQLCAKLYAVDNAVDKSLQGRNVLQSSCY